ncbi:sll0787 family AIR synthase-like protein [Radicibacter daui]|uniref:sll0787 family AIR synthase-like protein n=1 Tax=Radicibacter daui TaxID=3064829 RepID=UPI004046AC62
MSTAGLEQLASFLRAHPAIRSKLAIGDAVGGLEIGPARMGRPGDDAAILERPEGGFDLLAGEGFIPAFVRDDPWFAGWCGIMVNLSDIAAMGGRAVGVVDQVWSPDPEAARPLLAGLRDAAEAYGVAIVGGHTNFAAPELNLAVSIFGRAQALITSFDAQPGDSLVAVADHRGDYRNFDNFFAAGHAPAQRLRGDLASLPALAEAGLVRAGKDISQGGIAGTALMLAECSGVGIELVLDDICPPAGVPLQRWLHSFPSFGFLLAAAPAAASRVCQVFAGRDIAATVIGSVAHGSQVTLRSQGQSALFWDHGAAPYLGLGSREVMHA